MSDDRIVGGQILSDWQPTRDRAELALLGKTCEECNELGSAVARCLIQGIDGCEPITGKPNREWLEDELADVDAQRTLLIEQYGLDLDRMHARTARKLEHKRAWHSMLAAATTQEDDGAQRPHDELRFARKLLEDIVKHNGHDFGLPRQLNGEILSYLYGSHLPSREEPVGFDQVVHLIAKGRAVTAVLVPACILVLAIVLLRLLHH